MCTITGVQGPMRTNDEKPANKQNQQNPRRFPQGWNIQDSVSASYMSALFSIILIEVNLDMKAL